MSTAIARPDDRGAQKSAGGRDPAPVTIYNAAGASPFLLVADHAGNRLPRALGDLGVSAAERERHIGWDIGIAGVGRLLADALDAHAHRAELFAAGDRLQSRTGDADVDPGGQRTHADPRQCRFGRGRPGGARARCLLARTMRDRSGTGRGGGERAAPTDADRAAQFHAELQGQRAAWHARSYNRDPASRAALVALFRQEAGLIVGDNEPYYVSDATDFTIPPHAERHGLPHALIEIRQDLIEDRKGQRAWAERLARVLPAASSAFMPL